MKTIHIVTALANIHSHSTGCISGLTIWVALGYFELEGLGI